MASESLSVTAVSFTKTQRRVNSDLVKVVERVVFYSAGIISLSMTFIGSLLHDGTNPVRIVVHCVPLIYPLFFAWSALLLAFLSGLFVRWHNGKHLFFVDASDHYKKSQEFHSAQEKHVQSGLPVGFTGGVTKETFLENLSKQLEWDKKTHHEMQKGNKTAMRWKLALQYICFVSFIVGFIVLTASLMAIIAVI